MPEKLRSSPNFALTQSADGRAYVIGEVEPYPQFWLSARERLIFALFGARGGMAVAEATEALLRLSPAADQTAERRRIARSIAQMREAGVLIEPAAELSRYGKAMAQDYLDHRPFPAEIAARIAADSDLDTHTRVLDLAAGPGSLALELARLTRHVTMMELSRGFVAAARAEARRRGLALETINESCNRLAQLDETYNLITISQALHWLDDVAVVKGVCRTLAPGGSFFVVHGSLTLPAQHPLSYILGDETPLGNKSPLPFAEEARALFRRTSKLFEALDAPEIARHDPAHARHHGGRITGTAIALYRQRRPVGEGFARAFLSSDHIAALGQGHDAFWQDLTSRCAGASAEALIGFQDFAVLHFQRGASRLDPEAWSPPAPTEIGF